MAGTYAQGRRAAFLVVGVQLGVTILSALAAGLGGGQHAAWSALMGGLINVFASLYLVVRLFAGGLTTPMGWLRRVMVGEALKFGLTVLLFVVAIALLKAAFLPLIIAYVATYLAFWFGLARIRFGQMA
ncbi:MAG: ATP synthase subunit I [Gammaproteobacteria bacterium]